MKSITIVLQDDLRKYEIVFPIGENKSNTIWIHNNDSEGVGMMPHELLDILDDYFKEQF